MSGVPLAGLRIVVTRPAGQADALSELLEAAGATAIRFPTIAVRPATLHATDRAKLLALGTYDWVVFTSANGVAGAWRELDRVNLPRETWKRVHVAAIGPATAAALRAHGIEPDALPGEYLSERLADVVGPVTGRRFLLLRADIAGETLPAKLRAGGGHVDEVAVYRTVEAAPDAAALAAGDDIAAITFTSPSTVRGFVRVCGGAWPPALRQAAIVAIGPVTAEAARALGLVVAVQARTHTAAGLVAALIEHFAQPATGGTHEHR
jgi:uroporphyrinogen III methyltransferase/synthase